MKMDVSKRQPDSSRTYDRFRSVPDAVLRVLSMLVISTALAQPQMQEPIKIQYNILYQGYTSTRPPPEDLPVSLLRPKGPTCSP